MSDKSLAEKAFAHGKGILRMVPSWVPRTLGVPGRRLKLHADDYYAYGPERGGIDERWLTSTTPAQNGPLTTPEEGLSRIVFADGAETKQMLFRDAVQELGPALVGEKIWTTFHDWPVLAKLFDNKRPLPLHLHHDAAKAQAIGRAPKPEAYYFPPQYNCDLGDFPYTFFGFRPGVTKEDVRRCLNDFSKRDNRILDLSLAYPLQTGTAWNVPTGVLHAPGTLCTYEPQRASDVGCVFQSVAGDRPIPAAELWNGVPDAHKGDVEYLLDMIDWEKNADPDFAASNRMMPVPVKPHEETLPKGYVENWICYKSPDFSATEVTVMPRKTVFIWDQAAYGCLVVQGHGTMDVWDIETPSMVRFGGLTQDEFFVSEPAAKHGVSITNPSTTEPIVILKHFGPGNPLLSLP